MFKTKVENHFTWKDRSMSGQGELLGIVDRNTTIKKYFLGVCYRVEIIVETNEGKVAYESESHKVGFGR